MVVLSRADGHVPICALVLSRVIFHIYWLLIYVHLLYCNACVSIYVFHSHLYIAF